MDLPGWPSVLGVVVRLVRAGDLKGVTGDLKLGSRFWNLDSIVRLGVEVEAVGSEPALGVPTREGGLNDLVRTAEGPAGLEGVEAGALVTP